MNEEPDIAEVPGIDNESEESSGYADPDDVLIGRDDDGDKIRQDIMVDGVGLHNIEPMSYGDVQRYLGDGSQHEVEEEALARLFENFIVEPDYAGKADEWARKMGKKPRGRITAEFIEDWKPLMVREVLMALFEVSGIDADVMMEGTTANVDVGEEGNP